MTATCVWSQGTTLYSIGQPTDEEQLYLEMINRARANPTEEGLRLAASTNADVLHAFEVHGVDLELMKQEFAALPVRPPLAMNAKLMQMARAHTQDMFDHAFQGHTSFNGDVLADRVADVGYAFFSLGENVFSFANSVYHGHAGFQVDWGTVPGEEPDEDGMQAGRGHRVNIQGNYREIGLGVKLGMNTVGETTVGPQLVTQNFGSQVGSSAYVTGVAFYDVNGNGFYDLGEGIRGLTVNVEGSLFHAVTSTSGGYAVPVPTVNATREVTFTGLGLNGEFVAVITDGQNVKTDYKLDYSPPTPAGPVVADTGSPTTYTFNAVGGATGYDWQAMKAVPLANDGANDLTRVTPQTTGTYSALSTTVKHSGTGAYRLTHPAVAISSESVIYQETFYVQEGAGLSFRSRLRTASEDQVAKVQVSTNNGSSWEDVYAQPGATPAEENGLPGEGSFQLREISLQPYAGRQIRLRFLYEFLGGSLFPGTGDALGWYVDEVNFSGLLDASHVVNTAVAEGETEFEFTPAEAGQYLLAVRPKISGRDWAFSPPLAVASADTGTFSILAIAPAQVVKAGGKAEFQIMTTMEADSCRWLKNGKVIKGATETTLTLYPAGLQAAGTYTAEATKNGLTSTSLPFLLGVVEDVEKTVALAEGKSVKLTAKAAGPGLSYEWKRNGEPLEDSDQITGRLTKTLQLKGLQSGQSGTYTCEVKTGGSEPTAGGTTHLGVFDQAPALLPGQELEDSIVGGAYSYWVRFDETPGLAPATFSAKNLPSGMKINSKTGEIYGRPTKPVNATITVTAKNSFGSSVTTLNLVVHEFPANLAGSYAGLLGRHDGMNQQMGGRLDLKVTSLGTFSGSLMMGTRKVPVKGGLNITADGSELPHGIVEIPATAKHPGLPMELAFYVDTAKHLLNEEKSRITQGETKLGITGWRQKWRAKGEAATAYLGLHTFGLRLTVAGDEAVPQGWGFGSLKPAADGKIKLAGRTADGEAFTSASFIGPEGEVLVYQPLYKTPVKGSLLGTLQILKGNETDTADNTMSGGVSWTRPATAGTKARVYAAGFGLAAPVATPVELEAVGGSFFPPAADKVVLNLAPGEDNAEVKFEEGGLETAIVALNIAAKSKITPVTPAESPSAFKLAANVKTGAITGSFMLLDTPKRKVPLLGMLIREGEDYLGAGYLLVPELPSQAFPKITPIWSGRMTLEKKADVPD
ncbi:immunoglobulin domain-containing protein [Prosthecobacter sp. SYSU 5D2]|uniref:immunoglobulin domain-containing protein n=1 Tax=Prosthecobacter sp. SYSU 5D2 TaxID=3134134 RepID=UPI0031FEB927